MNFLATNFQKYSYSWKLNSVLGPNPVTIMSQNLKTMIILYFENMIYTSELWVILIPRLALWNLFQCSGSFNNEIDPVVIKKICETGACQYGSRSLSIGVIYIISILSFKLPVHVLRQFEMPHYRVRCDELHIYHGSLVSMETITHS